MLCLLTGLGVRVGWRRLKVLEVGIQLKENFQEVDKLPWSKGSRSLSNLDSPCRVPLSTNTWYPQTASSKNKGSMGTCMPGTCQDLISC